jgi:hypothetical protein
MLHFQRWNELGYLVRGQPDRFNALAASCVFASLRKSPRVMPATWLSSRSAQWIMSPSQSVRVRELTGLAPCPFRRVRRHPEPEIPS